MRRFLMYLFMGTVLGTLLLVKFFGPWESSEQKGPMIHVFLTNENKVVYMPLESYLVGVLAAEMPAKFEKEALKAQAIAARTYALKKIKFYPKTVNQEHPKAEICTNPSHCQGWLSEKEMKEKWGWFKFWGYQNKLKAAVEETYGKVITYENNLIDPVYHSTCGGLTENSQEVWTYAIPYLKSVPCKWDRESPKYQNSIKISFLEINNKLGVKIDVQQEGAMRSDQVIKILEKTSTGRMKMVQVGNKVLAATELRRIFGLNSTKFSWRIKDQAIEFLTTGYGHGVGMCQYGANGLAKNGDTAEKILKYYYSGVKIEKLY